MAATSHTDQAPVIVVADIGGTNARFALATGPGEVRAAKTYPVAEYPTLEGALLAYIAETGAAPTGVSLAVAGPVTDGRAAFTNSPWVADTGEIESALPGTKVRVLNDFEAVALYALAPNPDDLTELKSGNGVAGAPVVVLGPGTGLGQSLAIKRGAVALGIAAEGGHALMPAATTAEADILADLRGELGRPATVEDIVSGGGLLRLHHVMMPETKTDVTSPAEVTERAGSGDETAKAVIAQFFLFLATAASNAALGAGGRAGVIIAGGVVPRLLDFFDAAAFRERFVGQSPMADYLGAIPINLLTGEGAALKGAYRAIAD